MHRERERERDGGRTKSERVKIILWATCAEWLVGATYQEMFGGRVDLRERSPGVHFTFCCNYGVFVFNYFSLFSGNVHHQRSLFFVVIATLCVFHLVGSVYFCFNAWNPTECVHCWKVALGLFGSTSRCIDCRCGPYLLPECSLSFPLPFGL